MMMEALVQECMSVIEGHDVEMEAILESILSSYHEASEKLNIERARQKELETEIEGIQEAVKMGDRERARQRKATESMTKAIEATRVVKEEKERDLNTISDRVTHVQGALDEAKEILDEGFGWTTDQEKKLAQYQGEISNLEHLLDKKQTALDTLQRDVESIVHQNHDLELQKLALESEMSDTKSKIAANEKTISKLNGRKTQDEHDLKQRKSQVEHLQREIAEKQRLYEQGEQDLNESRKKVDTSVNGMSKISDDSSKLHASMRILERKLDTQKNDNRIISEQLHARQQEVEAKREERLQLAKELEELKKMQIHITGVIAQQEKTFEKADAERAQNQEKLKIAERELHVARKENESLQKQLTTSQRKQEVLTRNISKAGDRTKQINDLIDVCRATQSNLQNEVEVHKSQAVADREIVESVELDINRQESQVAVENQGYLNVMEESAVRDNEILQLQKKIKEGEAKLKQQQNLYENVRSERNMYSKNLIEVQKDVSDMKRNFKMLNQQIEQLKEEISAKDHALVKEHFNHHNVEKQRELFKQEVEKMRDQTQATEQIILNQEHEIRKLAQIISEADEEKYRQAKEYQVIVNERDMIGSQLTKNGDELKKLHEKLKLQLVSLRLGYGQHDDQDSKTLELQERIKTLEKERAKAQSKVACLGDLETEVVQLERELNHERAKVQALSVEMERPLNLHRWRKLEDSNPEQYELIQRVQSLQVRLIKMTQDVAIKSAQIEEKEKLYASLQEMLAKQPGPEIEDQIALYQENVKDKKKKVKEMNIQLKESREQVGKLKEELEMMNKIANDKKNEYLAYMKAEFLAQAYESNDESEEEAMYHSGIELEDDEDVETHN